jgi:hypothetical protein
MLTKSVHMSSELTASKEAAIPK